MDRWKADPVRCNMKIITIEEHLAGAPINHYLAKYAAEDAPYTGMAHGKGRPYDADPELFFRIIQFI